MLISNILSPHSQFSNCEEDEGETIFDANDLYAQNLESDKENNIPNPVRTPQTRDQTQEVHPRPQTVTVKVAVEEKIKVQISAYTAGYVCRKITKKIGCNSCSKTYTTNEIEDKGIHQYLKYREYKRLKRSNLVYPNGIFLRLYRETSQKIHQYLDENCHNPKINVQLRNIINKTDMSWLGCKVHGNYSIKQYFVPLIIRLHCHNWCTRINKILNGKIEEKHVSSMGSMAVAALNKYKKHRLRKMKINK